MNGEHMDMVATELRKAIREIAADEARRVASYPVMGGTWSGAELIARRCALRGAIGLLDRLDVPDEAAATVRNGLLALLDIYTKRVADVAGKHSGMVIPDSIKARARELLDPFPATPLSAIDYETADKFGLSSPEGKEALRRAGYRLEHAPTVAGFNIMPLDRC